MSLPLWLPIAISAAGTVIALSAFIYQVRRARFNQSVDLLFKMESKFFREMKEERAIACRDLEAGIPLEAEPILDFFETMALLLRRGALDTEMVWHTFSYWIEGYNAALAFHIPSRQQHDPTIWQDFPHLVRKMRSMQEKRSGQKATPMTDEQVLNFLAEEQTEASI
jgi:hypothetical protein